MFPEARYFSRSARWVLGMGEHLFHQSVGGAPARTEASDRGGLGCELPVRSQSVNCETCPWS